MHFFLKRSRPRLRGPAAAAIRRVFDAYKPIFFTAGREKTRFVKKNFTSRAERLTIKSIESVESVEFIESMLYQLQELYKLYEL
jgi:hypothetical protein